MTTPTQKFLTAFAHLVENLREQGSLFERLTKEWLLNVPDYQQQFEQVYLWKEFATQQHVDRTDTGIDLVARTHDGDYCAIQCKFFRPGYKLQKADIDSFFTASGQTYGKVKFSERKIVTTTAEWSQNAEAALDWIIDRYKITTHKTSKITNNPNHWSDNPRYIIDLIEKVVSVSMETVKITAKLPELKS